MKLLVAGGGTGGHVFTGIALAREWVERGADFSVVFVGTQKGLEVELVPKAGFRLECIPVYGFKRLSAAKKIRALLILPVSFLRAFALLWREKPDVVIGVGGYASLPVVIAASLMGIPTTIIEQNSVPGLANRLIGGWAGRIFLAFESARRFFSKDKCLWTGNPVRRELIPEALSGSHERNRFTVFVFGGSQGAKRLDQAALDAIPLLKKNAAQLRVIHQCKSELREPLMEAYKAAGLEAEVLPFIHAMGKVYGQADLVVCRSGALSTAEIATLGKPAVLVPYPFAADDHQMANARALSDSGAALLVADQDLSGTRLADLILSLMADEGRRREISRRALHFSSARSAQKIMDVCQMLALGARG